MSPTVGELLTAARRRLLAAPFEPSTREAALLLGAALGLSEAQLLARDRDPVPEAPARRFGELLERRLSGEPVAYLLGRREFYGRDFRVDPRVLIPRPESEHLVEVALGLSLPPAPRILDLGAGSGCLAVTLAAELPCARVVATDRSLGALAVAAANARHHGVAGRLALIAADWRRGLRVQGFDLLVSNPPYVDPRQRPELSPEVAEHEPATALFAAGRGLAAYRQLLEQTRDAADGTPFLLEIGAGQLADVAALAATLGWPLQGAETDYAGIPRVAVLRRRPPPAAGRESPPRDRRRP
ncbi:MAG TPA: peptide chain release factor N(5)-glutamine methyltransferase [Thermoanaerobaculia bacterium]|nr:peptide chain release factor N(5)-glutamine methyltransferase [Thermoanaerobaculia bacterium]